MWGPKSEGRGCRAVRLSRKWVTLLVWEDELGQGVTEMVSAASRMQQEEHERISERIPAIRAWGPGRRGCPFIAVRHP